MHTLIIPGQYRKTTAVQARYIEGWQAGLGAQEHGYSNELAADAFKRKNGAAQLRSYSAGYEAGLTARADVATPEPLEPPAK